MILQEGDRVAGGENDLVQMGFPADTSRLTLKGEGEFRFVRARIVELLKGELEAVATGEMLAVATPHSELRAGNAHARLRSAAEFARVDVLQGSAVLVRKSDGRSVRVEASQYAVAGKGVDLVARAIDKAAPAADAPAAVARLLHVQGDVYLFTQAPADRSPARAGTELRKGQGIVTEGSRSLAVLEFPDRTRLEIGPDAVVRRLVSEDGSSKLVRLEAGRVTADVTKQPAGRPMKIATAHAEAAVLGTRFLLTSEKDATLIQVEEGAVQFTAVQDRKSVVVRSGYQATAAPGRPLEEPALVPGGVRYLEIDLEAGESKGDGLWRVAEGRAVRQEKASPRPGGEAAATHLYKVDLKEGALLEAMVEVTQVAPDTLGGREGWGFGLAAAFDSRDVILRSQQGAGSGSVLEFQDAKAIPFEHGQEGRYRLKLRIERRGDTAALLGKIWQGEREPDGWMIQDDMELKGPMTRVGFQSVRCACVFSSFRVKILN